MNIRIEIHKNEDVSDPEASVLEKTIQSIEQECPISSVHIGRFVTFEAKNTTSEKALEIAERLCDKILINHNTEHPVIIINDKGE